MEHTDNYNEKYNAIASMIMRGCNGKIERNQVLCNEFKTKYHELISYLLHTLPLKMSVGVKAALGKAILWYGEDKIKPFCEKISKKDFAGHDDPALVLWEWLINKSKRRCDTTDTYRVTVKIIRNYVKTGKINPITQKGIARSISDIFEWRNNYTEMVTSQANKNLQHSEGC